MLPRNSGQVVAVIGGVEVVVVVVFIGTQI